MPLLTCSTLPRSCDKACYDEFIAGDAAQFMQWARLDQRGACVYPEAAGAFAPMENLLEGKAAADSAT